MCRIVRTPSWSRNLFSEGELAGIAFGFYGPSFVIGRYDPSRGSAITFNDSGIRRRRRRKLRQRKTVDRVPVAIPVLSGF